MTKTTFQRLTTKRVLAAAPDLRFIAFYHRDEERLNSIIVYSAPTYYKTYFCIGKEDVIDADFIRLLVYACYDEYMDGAYRWTVYTPLTFRNLLLTADGNIELEYGDGQSSVFQTSPEYVEEFMEEQYLVDEIYIEF